ncbi:MAG: metallophosphoesterase [Lachnospiraceae bacterium]|nr:metallophosphoesterase [Lachnospiraceae bacterium]
MKVLIVSDTHRQNMNLYKVLGMYDDIDMLLHLGDAEGGEDFFAEVAGCPIEIVSGNCDFFSNLPRERIITLGKYNVWMTHGHQYNVSFTFDRLISEAEYRNIDIVMFGHIHRPLVEKHRNITLVNPGSLSYPRQANRKPSYVIMEIDDAGEAHFEIKYLKAD